MYFIVLILAVIILAIENDNKSREIRNLKNEKNATINSLEAEANIEKDSKIKSGILKALSFLKNESVPQYTKVSSSLQDTSSASQENLLSDTAVVASKASANYRTSQPQSNAITLLYVGAFLFVTAVIIFIAAPVLSGSIKTMLVLATALLFYATGMWLHQKTKQFKPAGQTFVAIGMIILPLVGIAAYNLIYNKEHAYGIWFATSIVTFATYIFTLSKFRTTLMGYLSVLSALSLVESSVLTTGLPLYYISWTIALIAIALAVLSKIKNVWPEQKEPLQFSANLLLPTALAVAVFNIQTYGWWQFTAALVLSSAFYAYSALDNEKLIHDRSLYVAISLLSALFVVPSFALAIHATTEVSLLSLLTATAIIVSNTAIFTRLGKNPLFNNAFYALGFIPFGCVWFLLDANIVIATVLLCFVIFTSIAYALRSVGWLVVGFIPLLAFPVSISYARNVPLSSQTMMTIYTLLGMFVLAVRTRLEMRSVELKTAISGLYLFSIFVGFAIATYQSISLGALILLFDCFLLAVASYVEKEPLIFGIAYAGMYVATTMVLTERSRNVGLHVSLAYAGLAYIGYLLSEIYSSDRAKIVQRIAIVGAFVASISSFVTETSNTYPPIIMLFVASIMLYYQAKKEDNSNLESVAYVSFTSAVSWLLFNSSIRELLAYTHLWAFTFGLMYLWRAKNNDKMNAENFLILSLISFSIPFALQVLGDTGGIRGWLFVIEHILLMVFGMLLRKEEIIRWGLIATVGAVLFQLRDLTFLLLGLLGLSVIGLAIWLLNRESKK